MREARRIVSLLPSATEIVCALGLGDRLVAISHNCDFPPSIAALPRVSRPRAELDGLTSGEIDAKVRATLQQHGSVYEIDVAQIACLAPDLVLTQGICDVCAVPESLALTALAGLSPAPRILTLDAHDLAAIDQSIRDVGCAAGAPEHTAELRDGIARRIARVRQRVVGRPRPRVLAVEWLDPPYVPGHWVPEMVAAAGGELVAGVARRPSYRLDWAALEASAPDVVLVMPCGFDLPRAWREAERHHAQLARSGAPCYVLDASAYFSRSGPRVADGIETLAAVLHPDCFRDTSVQGRATIFPGR